MKIGQRTTQHDQLIDITPGQHHALLHAAASHNDQAATGAELNTLVGGGETALHSHAAAGLVLIATLEAASSADLTITGLDSTFDTYLILMSDIVPTTDGAILWFRVGDSGGIDSGVTDYSYHSGSSRDSSTSYLASASIGAAQFVLTSAVGSVAGEGGGGALWLHRPGDGSIAPLISGTMVAEDSAGVSRGGDVHGRRTAAIVLDRIQILFSAGNIASGRLSVYGVNHA